MSRMKHWLTPGVISACLTATLWGETVSFQNGTGGYAGTLDIRISSSGHFYDGTTMSQYQFDGRAADNTGTDRWGLIRFSDLFGTQPGQVRAGATILSARLEFTTSTQAEASAAESGGPIGVARMLKPFDTTTRWSSFGAEGPDFAGGDYDRPAGGYRSMRFEQTHGADVTSIVQAWSDGAPNHGFIVICSATDAWYIHTSGHPDVPTRPRLVVEYSTLRTRAITLQQGLDGYAGCSMIIVNQEDVSTAGETLGTTYLDGYVGTTTPPEPAIDGLIRFDGVFGSGPGQISAGTPVVKAYLALTTAPKAESFQTRSPGPYDIHALQVEVDWSLSDWSKPSLWSDFNGDGPTEADGEIGPVLSSVQGLAWDARPWFDVTTTVQSWQAGATNYGFNIKAATSDGWKIYCTGSAAVEARPQLILFIPSKRADFDLDGDVDGDDFLLFEGCASGPAIPAAPACGFADLDSDQDVDQNDFAAYQTCFSGTQPASPECR